MASSPKFKTVFGCQACGFESSKWLGRCPDCGEWNSFVEERQEVPTAAAKGRAPSPSRRRARSPSPTTSWTRSDAPRIPSGIGEFDRVLGGGIVPGSMVLIGGEPGIGKSTLLLQVAHLLGRQGGAVLYVSGEESEKQIKMRGERLGHHGRRPLPDGGDEPGAHPRARRSAQARGAGRRLRADRSTRRASRPRPAASARCARSRPSSSCWPRAAGSRPSSSAT